MMTIRKLEKRLIEAYQSQRVNELQVAITLFYCRIYRVARAHYKRLFADSPNGHHRASGWQWAGFPRLPAIFSYYQFLSTAYMAYVLLRNLILLDHLNWFFGAKLEKPNHCYLVGYFHINPAISRGSASILAFVHLSWRLYQALMRRPYFIPMLFFLNFSSRDMRRVKRQSLASNGGHTQLNVLESKTIDAPASTFHLFRRILCYKVEYNDHTSYKLRPNRTLESRRKLRKRVAQCVFYIGGCFLILLVVITTTIMIFELNDKQYLMRYPGCDLELEVKNARNELSNWSYSAHKHQLLTLVFCVLENFIIWVDSGVALMFVWTTVYLLNYDTQLHWIKLNRKLERLHLRVRAEYQKHRKFSESSDDEMFSSDNQHPASSKNLDSLVSKSIISEPFGEGSLKWHYGKSNRNCEAQRPTIALPPMPPMPRKLEEALHDLQANFYDFFLQIEESDLIISDIITATIFIWLIGFSFLGHMLQRLWPSGSSDEHLGLAVVIVCCEGLSFVMVTAVSFSLLELHRNCLRSYETLCSLMAYDRSKYKLRLSILLQFYTVKQRSAYTIMQQYPYTKTTYLSIFGWSLSCLFILDNLIRR